MTTLGYYIIKKNLKENLPLLKHAKRIFFWEEIIAKSICYQIKIETVFSKNIDHKMSLSDIPI